MVAAEDEGVSFRCLGPKRAASLRWADLIEGRLAVAENTWDNTDPTAPGLTSQAA